MNTSTFIDEEKINLTLRQSCEPTQEELAGILKKGRTLVGLSLEEVALLINTTGADELERIFDTAAYVKKTVYGERLVLFAPLYLSNYCVNDCAYCGFHSSNKGPRKRLSTGEIREQVSLLIDMGHKRLLLEAGEDPVHNKIDYILDAIDTIYSVKRDKGEIRRLNVNIAATTIENYKRLKEKGIGTYQLFQESYHRETYEGLHKGPKSDYRRQLYALDSAFAGGIDDVGIGVLFGLYDWRFEVMALVAHALYLSKEFGVGPHTISVPRFRPASTVGLIPPSPVSDDDFLKLIAILRIAVPYTGMIITTRESPDIRASAFRVGVTQASAASSTAPGGLGKNGDRQSAQFELSDKRSLDEVASDIMSQGFTPSFCTACYRKKRTGAAFMELARPDGSGDIDDFCEPNSLLTLMEYLLDNATCESKVTGLELIEKRLGKMQGSTLKKETEERLERIRQGERDLFF